VIVFSFTLPGWGVYALQTLPDAWEYCGEIVQKPHGLDQLAAGSAPQASGHEDQLPSVQVTP
jgi:hypothetical protein